MYQVKVCWQQQPINNNVGWHFIYIQRGGEKEMDNRLISKMCLEEIKEELLEHSLRNNIEYYLEQQGIPYERDDVEDIWWDVINLFDD